MILVLKIQYEIGTDIFSIFIVATKTMEITEIEEQACVNDDLLFTFSNYISSEKPQLLGQPVPHCHQSTGSQEDQYYH